MKFSLGQLRAKRRRPRIYSDEAILCAFMIKAVYKLPFRALRGLMLSMIVLLGLNLKIPCYTRVCRRAAELRQKIKQLGDKNATTTLTQGGYISPPTLVNPDEPYFNGTSEERTAFFNQIRKDIRDFLKTHI